MLLLYVNQIKLLKKGYFLKYTRSLENLGEDKSEIKPCLPPTMCEGVLLAKGHVLQKFMYDKLSLKMVQLV